MRHPERIPGYLDDMRRFGATAARVVARGEARFFDPDDDDQRRIAQSIILDMNTAAERLGEDFRASHPEINWAGLRGTRNFIAHAYEDADDHIIWRVLTDFVPQMLRDLGLDD